MGRTAFTELSMRFFAKDLERSDYNEKNKLNEEGYSNLSYWTNACIYDELQE